MLFWYMKTTVYVYPRLLSMCLCAPESVDFGISRIETVYQSHVSASMAARLDQAECWALRLCKRLAARLFVPQIIWFHV